MLWDCPAYSSIRSVFMLELRRELGDRFEHFQGLDSFAKSSGSEANYASNNALLISTCDLLLAQPCMLEHLRLWQNGHT